MQHVYYIFKGKGAFILLIVLLFYGYGGFNLQAIHIQTGRITETKTL